MKTTRNHRRRFRRPLPVGEQLRNINRTLKKMTDADERLAQEVGETRTAFVALVARFQAKTEAMQTQIDTLKAALAAGDTTAANAAADALDALQTDMAAVAADPAPEPAPAPEGGDADGGAATEA